MVTHSPQKETSKLRKWQQLEGHGKKEERKGRKGRREGRKKAYKKTEKGKEGGRKKRRRERRKGRRNRSGSDTLHVVEGSRTHIWM